MKVVLNDEGFKLPSTEAKLAFTTAAQVMAWMDSPGQRPADEAIYEQFVNHLFSTLLICFQNP